ncbi:GNAT family N-acetyltransferase [Enterococcus sp. LJL128]
MGFEIIVERIYSVKDENFADFSKMKVDLIQYHAAYAEKLGFVDEMALNYSSQDVLEYFLNNDYNRYIIKYEGEAVGILEYYFKDSDVVKNEKCIYIDNLFIKEEYRGRGFSKLVLSNLVIKCKNIELSCYYDLPANDFYKKIGFKKLYTTYFRR